MNPAHPSVERYGFVVLNIPNDMNIPNVNPSATKLSICTIVNPKTTCLYHGILAMIPWTHEKTKTFNPTNPIIHRYSSWDWIWSCTTNENNKAFVTTDKNNGHVRHILTKVVSLWCLIVLNVNPDIQTSLVALWI